MTDVQINTPAPAPSAPIVVPVERASNNGPGTMLAIIVAVVLGAALVWYFVGYRPTTSSVTTAPANSSTTINVNVPPVNVNAAPGSNAAPVPAAGASNAPAKPAAGAAP
jgi:cytoskeletal protein RodZ